ILIVIIIILSIGVGFGVYKIIQIEKPKAQTENVVVEKPKEKEEVVIEQVKLDDKINSYLKDNGIKKGEVGIYIHNFKNNEEYVNNIDANFVAGSTYKLPLAILYYEAINNGSRSLSDTIYYDDSFNDDGDITMVNSNHYTNTVIDLKTLLSYLIVYSDNTAGNMLYDDLGGWATFREVINKYKDKNDASIVSYENEFTAKYMNSVLNYLYNNASSYETLISDLKLAENDNYLKKYVNVEIAQKYGLYGNAVSTVGIVYGNQPYSIVIYTNLGEEGKEHIANINKITYEYFG
ncbi:MAG: serine hydrolase, partial [Erysipelotrichaceae bacterium]